ncbi:putative lipid II flippase FtsW [Patescibacteria group bacterium]|nr:putative lipid II flippase FtsW [Patescibacteria group bacterium]
MNKKILQTANRPDYVFIVAVGLLLLFGLIFLASASSVLAFNKFGDSYYYIKRQLLYGVGPGLILCLAFSRLPYQKLRQLAMPILIVTLFLMLLVFVPGVGFEYGGARRWIHLFGNSLQPSEILKLAFIIYLSAWLAGKGEQIKKFKEGILPFVLITGLTLVFVLLQRDLGTTSVIGVSAFFILLASGANLSHLAGLIGSGSLLAWLMIKLEPYRAARLTVFLHPELDPQGIGYHINQALLAVGSGGFFGLGLGYSRQKHAYLPEVTGDSIFAIIAEELGFLFTSIFVMLIGFVLWRGFKIARYAPDNFGRYLTVGILVWLGWQSFINIASMLNLLPLTGVPLPFVSAGGSALMIALSGIGIIINVSRQAHWKERL